MKFSSPLISGILLRRYKRFLVDVRLSNGQEVTAHCANPGRMTSCATPGWEVRLSAHQNPRRKLPFTLEMVHNGQGWIGVNTQWPNRLAAEAIVAGEIPELAGYEQIQREVNCGKSRLDFCLRRPGEHCYVEVKSVSLVTPEDRAFAFPDAVTQRGAKHLHTLIRLHQEGNRAVMLFVIQRADGDFFRPAGEIDPHYAAELLRARAAGVEIIAFRFAVSPDGITPAGPVSCRLTATIPDGC